MDDVSLDAAFAAAVFHANPLPMTVLRRRPDGSIVVAAINPAAADTTGWDADGVRGATLEQLYPAEHAARTRGFLEELEAPGSVVDYRVEGEVATGRRAYQVRLIRLADHGGDRVVVSLSCDVTRAEAAEEALEETQRLGRIGHFSWNVETGELSWTPQMYELFGFPVGSQVTVDDVFGRLEDPAPLRAVLDEAMATAGSYEIEITIVRPDGTRRIGMARGTAFLGRDGAPVRVAGTTQDITEQRAAEQDARALVASRAKQAQALELNDDVLQGLATVRLALMQGEHDLAVEVLDRTLESARNIISDLLRDRLDSGPIPGDLVRRVSTTPEAPS